MQTYDYEHINDLVSEANLELSTSEIHGISCGMICAGVTNLRELWKQAIFTDVDPEAITVQAAKKALDEVLDNTETEITRQEMMLTLLLPDENNALTERAAAIRDWCQGYLYGFGLAGPQDASLFSEDAGEALQDFSEISKLQPHFIEEEGLDESLSELQEFLWVAALLIHQDVIGKRPAEQKYDH